MNSKETLKNAMREFMESQYNEGADLAMTGADIAEVISNAAADVWGKKSAAYLLDATAYRVQSWCNPVLND